MINETDIIGSINVEYVYTRNHIPNPDNDADKISSITTTFHTVQDNKPVCIYQSILKNDNDEQKLISDWIELIKEKKPKIIIGWYIFSLDYIYLEKRAIKLGIAETFSKELGCIGNRSIIKDMKKSYSVGNINKLDLMRFIENEKWIIGNLFHALKALDIPLPIYDKNNLDKYSIDLCLAYAEIFYKVKFIEYIKQTIDYANNIKKLIK